MYRVVTKYRDRGRSRPIVEYGPWHPTHHEAEFWAEHLRAAGYIVDIESQRGTLGGSDHDELAAAIANMA